MTESGERRVLLVDDEQAVLDGLSRQHRKHFDIVSACGVEAGLEALRTRGPFAVVVSDYKMPVMNGAQFLAKAREMAPDTCRVMLTGQTDLGTAVEAVNRGSLFRFLTKPCDPELFRSVVEAGIEQHRLVGAERSLLEETVKGSIEVLAEVLSLSNPAAFGRATRVCRYVKHMVADLGLPDAWQYETAALLSQIGCVAVPHDVFDRLSRGEQLPPDQLRMLDKHPELARDLLGRIPRLAEVAAMVFHQQPDNAAPQDAGKEVRIGSRILAAALAYDELLSLGATAQQATAALKRDVSKYGARILQALATVDAAKAWENVSLVPIRDLLPGMVLEEDVRGKKNGMLIVPRGHLVTASSLKRLLNYNDLGLLMKDAFRIRIAVGGQGRRDAAA